MSVIRADSTRLPLADESVDLIVTSPPYFALRSYRDGDEHYGGQIGAEPTPNDFLNALWGVTQECARVLKPSGSMFVNLGDKYAGSGGHNNSGLGAATDRGPTRYNQDGGGVRHKSLMGLPWRYAIGCVDRLNLILRAEIVWAKPNGLPEPHTDRVRRSHETWFHLVKEPSYFAGIDEIREPHVGVDNANSARGPSGTNRGLMTGLRDEPVGNFARDPRGKVPGSVWTIPLEPLTIPQWAREKFNLPDHYAAFPQEWPRRIILGWSPTDGLVLDPFGGTGTVAMVARSLGRRGVSVDLSADYCRLARWRIEDSGHSKKSESRTWAERQGTLL